MNVFYKFLATIIMATSAVHASSVVKISFINKTGQTVSHQLNSHNTRAGTADTYPRFHSTAKQAGTPQHPIKVRLKPNHTLWIAASLTKKGVQTSHQIKIPDSREVSVTFGFASGGVGLKISSQ